MVIVSQDKDWIFNFDNTTSIGIDEENTLKVISIAGKWNILGNYKTKERAKEIIQQIYCKYEHSKHLLSSKSISVQNITDYDFIYEMPQE